VIFLLTEYFKFEALNNHLPEAMRTPSFPATAAALFTAGAKAATNNTWQEDALSEVTYLHRQKQVYLADRLKKIIHSG